MDRARVRAARRGLQRSFAAWRGESFGATQQQATARRVVARWRQMRLTGGFETWRHHAEELSAASGALTRVLARWRDKAKFGAFALWAELVQQRLAALDTLQRLLKRWRRRGLWAAFLASWTLWGVLPLESPLQVVELDHATGSVLQTIRVATTLDITNLDTFAFAAWDGEFYLFARYYGMGNNTEVYQIDRSGNITQVVDDLGINVVGAGVSTCAPT